MLREAQPRASPGGCWDPQHFIILIKLTWGSLSGIATCHTFLPCSWQTQDCLCMGKAESEEWINYLQKSSRFISFSLEHQQWTTSLLSSSGLSGCLQGVEDLRVVSGQIQGAGSLGRELSGLFHVHLLLLCMSSSRKKTEQRQPAPSLLMSHQNDSTGGLPGKAAASTGFL